MEVIEQPCEDVRDMVIFLAQIHSSVLPNHVMVPLAREVLPLFPRSR